VPLPSRCLVVRAQIKMNCDSSAPYPSTPAKARGAKRFMSLNWIVGAGRILHKQRLSDKNAIHPEKILSVTADPLDSRIYTLEGLVNSILEQLRNSASSSVLGATGVDQQPLADKGEMCGELRDMFDDARAQVGDCASKLENFESNVSKEMCAFSTLVSRCFLNYQRQIVSSHPVAELDDPMGKALDKKVANLELANTSANQLTRDLFKQSGEQIQPLILESAKSSVLGPPPPIGSMQICCRNR
jgi:hypothetical protein